MHIYMDGWGNIVKCKRNERLRLKRNIWFYGIVKGYLRWAGKGEGEKALGRVCPCIVFDITHPRQPFALPPEHWCILYKSSQRAMLSTPVSSSSTRSGIRRDMERRRSETRWWRPSSRLAELAKHRINGVERRIDLFSDLKTWRVTLAAGSKGNEAWM